MLNHFKTAYKIGIDSEEIAVEFLKSKGFGILHQRYKTKFGEVDIIGKIGEVLVFIEVKARKKIDEYETLVSQKQWKRITEASQVFLQENLEFSSHDFRFDQIVIEHGLITAHIENIFFDF